MTGSVVSGGGAGTTGGWPHELDAEYEYLGELGRGGMAVVYRASERALGRDVAIKVVRPRFQSDSESVARLAREARTVAQLEHPNIVSLHAVKRLEQGLALVMQLVPGETLKSALARGPLDAESAEHVLRDIARALAYAHRCGVVHRDVKPENIFLDEITGRALLSDFGVARSIEENTELTATGTAIGTPTYMSPEQIDGGHLDGRSDLYSLGMVGWEMLTGRRPWAGESLYSVIYRQKHDPLPPLDAIRPDVAPRLQYLIEGLMAKNPDGRWASAARFVTLLSSNSPLPGIKEWQAAGKRRRKSAPEGVPAVERPPGVNAATATMKFRRGDTPPGTPGAVAPAGVDGGSDDGDATQRLNAAGTGSTFVIPDEVVAPTPVRKRVILGALATLVAMLLVAVLSRRHGADLLSPPDSMRFADRSGVEVPVLRSSDSLAAAGRPIVDSSALVAAALDTAPPAVAPIAPSPRDSLTIAAGRADSSRRTDSLARVAKAKVVAPRPSQKVDPKPPVRPTTAPPAVIAARPGATRPAVPLPSTSVSAAAAAPTPPPVTVASGRDSTPLRVPTAATVSFTPDRGAIAAGGHHSCMIDAAGRALCWGSNERGQLGDGTFDARAEPAPVTGELNFGFVSAGAWHSCGVTRDGETYCWGNNDAGQLGDGTTSSRPVPVRVSGNSPYRTVRSGQSHTCALTRGGGVACWGSNAQGQLGDGSRATRTTPTTVALGGSAGALAVGAAHSCALTTEGVAMCWGQNGSGQLGDGSTTDRAVPTPVATDQRFVNIAAGLSHTCAVSTGGAVYCWGKNNYGQLGIGTSGAGATRPQAVDAPVSFATVTAGSVHSCARTRDGRAWCWGRNSYGQLGDGTATDRSKPVAVRGATVFGTLNASGAHTCGATVGGEGFCWGFNIDGQLGGGDRDNANTPARVLGASR